MASYLLAICAARLKDNAGVKKNIDAALAKDPTLRARAQNDLEFRNHKAALGM